MYDELNAFKKYYFIFFLKSNTSNKRIYLLKNILILKSFKKFLQEFFELALLKYHQILIENILVNYVNSKKK